MIVVRDLRKSYDGRVAVDGLSFEVAKGETLGFLGPNGAGKSTTIHALTGLILPDSGSVALDGREDPTQPDVRRCLGLAPQALALYMELSADENLAFFKSDVAPRIKASEGFRGLRNMMNRATGEGIVGTAWSDQEALNRAAADAQTRRDEATSRGVRIGERSMREIVLVDLK